MEKNIAFKICLQAECVTLYVALLIYLSVGCDSVRRQSTDGSLPLPVVCVHRYEERLRNQV